MESVGVIDTVVIVVERTKVLELPNGGPLEWKCSTNFMVRLYVFLVQLTKLVTADGDWLTGFLLSQPCSLIHLTWEKVPSLGVRQGEGRNMIFILTQLVVPLERERQFRERSTDLETFCMLSLRQLFFLLVFKDIQDYWREWGGGGGHGMGCTQKTTQQALISKSIISHPLFIYMQMETMGNN